MSNAGDGNGGVIGVNNPTTSSDFLDPDAGGASGVWSINDVLLALKRQEWPLVDPWEIDATGGTITTAVDPASPNGFAKIHTFTGTDSFVVNSAPPSASVQYLVVAGGGQQGSNVTLPFGPTLQGGGGGAGGMLTGSEPVSAGTHPIVVGATGPSGSPSSALGVTCTGGGRGGNGGNFGAVNGVPGGSGGGGGRTFTQPFPYVGGSGIPGQGNPGGTKTPGAPTNDGAGGGGANGAGGFVGGGSGRPSSINGTNVVYAVGMSGGGSSPTTSGSGGRNGIVILRYLGK